MSSPQSPEPIREPRTQREEPKWIRFVEGIPAAKTKRWNVVVAESQRLLGFIAWFPPWRRYAFYPNPQTVYEGTCLRDIAAFCELQTIAHRSASSASVAVKPGGAA